MNFNFDEPSCLEPDQIPQSVREYQMNLIYHLHRVKVKVGGSIIVHLVIKATHNHIISKNIGKKNTDFHELSNVDPREEGSRLI